MLQKHITRSSYTHQNNYQNRRKHSGNTEEVIQKLFRARANKRKDSQTSILKCIIYTPKQLDASRGGATWLGLSAWALAVEKWKGRWIVRESWRKTPAAIRAHQHNDESCFQTFLPRLNWTVWENKLETEIVSIHIEKTTRHESQHTRTRTHLL